MKITIADTGDGGCEAWFNNETHEAVWHENRAQALYRAIAKYGPKYGIEIEIEKYDEKGNKIT